jgi:PKD repeat protein
MVSGPSGPRLVDERILIQDGWYQQYPSHSIGDLAFGPDGMLYVSGGEGASYQFADFGDAGQIDRTHPNPGDPVHEGGALRSQDLLTGGDALGLSGAILRVDPDTGLAAAGNPIAGVRQVAFGLRNPFRIGFRPGTRELWIGDVGEDAWEEVNRIADVTDAVVENFGWPCYEGAGPHAGFEDHALCASLIGDTLPAGTPGKNTAPFFTYRHGQAPGYNLAPSGCQNGGSQAISGIAFYRGGGYPSQYQRALFFADYGVNCIYAMRAGASGIPDPGQIDVVERAAEIPVSLEAGPGGDIFYASVGGAIRRIIYGELTAKATADTTTGDDPLTVHFDGGSSRDPAGGALTYAWDLDGDGAFNDSTDVRPVRTYPMGAYSVRLRVADRAGKTAVSPPLVVTAGVRPRATITAPAAGAPWKAGQRISFAGTASDQQDGELPARAMKWRVVLLHCPLGGCHQHPSESFDGVASGSFVASPDGYPAYYDIELTATDSSGFTGKATVRIDAIGAELTFQTSPPGLPLLYTGAPVATPARVTEVAGDAVTVEAPSPQSLDGASYVFTGWSDGGDRAHVVDVPDGARTYTASYELDADGDGLADSTDSGGCAAGGGGGAGALVVVGLVMLLRSRPRRSSAARCGTGCRPRTT